MGLCKDTLFAVWPWGDDVPWCHVHCLKIFLCFSFCMMSLWWRHFGGSFYLYIVS
jgi:hypothetical protein